MNRRRMTSFSHDTHTSRTLFVSSTVAAIDMSMSMSSANEQEMIVSENLVPVCMIKRGLATGMETTSSCILKNASHCPPECETSEILSPLLDDGLIQKQSSYRFFEPNMNCSSQSESF